MQVPDYIASCREDLNRQIGLGLRDIEKKNDIVRGLNSLTASKKVERVKLSRRVSKKRRLRITKLKLVKKRCEELWQEYFHKNEYFDVDELNEEYKDRMCDYLQVQLNITFNMKDGDVRLRELADAIFHYLMNEEPDQHVTAILLRLYDPLYIRTSKDSWYESCCVMLQENDIMFTEFYKRFDHNKTALEYFLYKQPQLLLNEGSGHLMSKLIEHLPFDNLHQILTNIRTKNGQTHMFHVDGHGPYVILYTNHVDDLYALLSIRNNNGQTALHVNTSCITRLLAETYTPRKRDAFIELTSAKNNKNRTALQVKLRQAKSSGLVFDKWDYHRLSSLINRVVNNEYVMFTWVHTNVLIIYNTNRRSGAEEEANTIHSACKSVYSDFNITLESDKNENEIMELINQAANRREFGLPKSLIVILMSHGSVGTIDDCNGIPIKLSTIEEAMCSDVLLGKPKMLITQCCQNTTKEADEKLVAYSPKHDHFCAVMSSVPGHKSERGIFLGKLAEQIRKSERGTNIYKLVNRVSAEMEITGHKQTPIILSTLKAELCPTDMWYKEMPRITN